MITVRRCKVPDHCLSLTLLRRILKEKIYLELGPWFLLNRVLVKGIYRSNVVV